MRWNEDIYFFRGDLIHLCHRKVKLLPGVIPGGSVRGDQCVRCKTKINKEIITAFELYEMKTLPDDDDDFSAYEFQAGLENDLLLLYTSSIQMHQLRDSILSRLIRSDSGEFND
jgi:hypothetical protein